MPSQFLWQEKHAYVFSQTLGIRQAIPEGIEWPCPEHSSRATLAK